MKVTCYLYCEEAETKNLTPCRTGISPTSRRTWHQHRSCSATPPPIVHSPSPVTSSFKNIWIRTMLGYAVGGSISSCPMLSSVPKLRALHSSPVWG